MFSSKHKIQFSDSLVTVENIPVSFLHWSIVTISLISMIYCWR